MQFRETRAEFRADLIKKKNKISQQPSWGLIIRQGGAGVPEKPLQLKSTMDSPVHSFQTIFNFSPIGEKKTTDMLELPLRSECAAIMFKTEEELPGLSTQGDESSVPLADPRETLVVRRERSKRIAKAPRVMGTMSGFAGDRGNAGKTIVNKRRNTKAAAGKIPAHPVWPTKQPPRKRRPQLTRAKEPEPRGFHLRRRDDMSAHAREAQEHWRYCLCHPADCEACQMQPAHPLEPDSD